MALYRDKVRKDWIYQFEYQGRKLSGRGFKTKGEADAARAAHRKRLKEEAKKQQNGIEYTTFGRACLEYLNDAKKRFSTNTYDYKADRIKKLVAALPHPGPDAPVGSVTDAHIRTALDGCISNYNFNAYRKDYHALWVFFREKEYIAFNPVDRIKPLPHTPARKIMPSEKQVLQMILACDGDQRTLFVTTLHLLGRIDEILRLTWQDVNLSKRTVTLWTRKRKGGAYESDVMPMNADLHSVLSSHYKARTQETWVFYNEKTETRYTRRPKMMKGICRKAFDPACKSISKYQGPVFGWHHLRHFMASYLADEGKWSTKTMQKLLRHKEGRTTEIYLHQLGDGLRDAVTGIEGRFMVAGHGCGSDEKNPQQDGNTATGE